MADQTPRRRAVAAWGETRRVARPWGPTLVWATATDEPQGSCRRGTTPAAGSNLLGLSKVRGALAAGCTARHRERNSVATAVRRNFDRHACRPARESCIAAGVDATSASRGNHHCQEQDSGLACLSSSLAAGQKTCLGTGGFSLHALHCGAQLHPEGRTSLPAGRNGLCTSRRWLAARGFSHWYGFADLKLAVRR